VNNAKRVCARIIFNQPFSFELCTIARKIKNIKQNGIGLNISSSGLGMKTRYSLMEGSVVKFILPLGEAEITVPVFAEVIWSMPADNHFSVGLRFLA
jgi:hypothetical protein